MTYLLQIDFPTEGPWGDAMADAYSDLAASIADQPGLLWKVWTESEPQGVAGGIYVFDTEENARGYLDLHTRRLAGFGITNPRALVLKVNETLTATTRGPVA